MQEVIKGSEGRALTPDSQTAHVDHVLWLRGTWEKDKQKMLLRKSSVLFNFVSVFSCVTSYLWHWHTPL